jgi:hypothetical protein
MEHSKPASLLLFLIVGTGLWTDVYYIGWDWIGILFLTSCTLLLVSLLTFTWNQLRLTKWTLLLGMGLAVVGTILRAH